MGPGDPFSKPAQSQPSHQPTMSVHVANKTEPIRPSVPLRSTPSTTPATQQPFGVPHVNNPQQTFALPSLQRAGVSTLVGVSCGAVLGIIALLSSWQGVLLVLATSCAGGFIAWFIWLVRFNRQRLIDAWHILKGSNTHP